MELFPLIAILLAFLLLIVLPARQRKKLQDQARAMQESLTVGTPVMTTGGMHGTVAGLGENTVDLEIAPGVVVTFVRQAILEVRKPVGTVGDGPGDPGLPGTGPDSTGGPGARPGNGTH